MALVRHCLHPLQRWRGSTAHDAKMKQVAQRKFLDQLWLHAPRGGICFVGSSTFAYWRHLRRDMAQVRACRILTRMHACVQCVHVKKRCKQAMQT